MRVLGIETSCDETAAAVVQDGTRILSNVVHSQIDIHKVYGGVVPEVAARSHIEVINIVINQAVQNAFDQNSATINPWDQIDAIAVTYAPGLIGSLLIGTLAARTLAILKNKPLYPIHHIESHIYANFLDTSTSVDELNQPSSDPHLNNQEEPRNPDQAVRVARLGDPLKNVSHVTDENFLGEDGEPGPGHREDERGLAFPILALVVSGGHTQLILLKNHGDFKIIGTTRDDAVGEVFDKVGKIIGLPYPGGPSISKAALKGNRDAYQLPKAKLDSPYDFSFSGLKTATLRAVQKAVDKPISFPSYQLADLLTEKQRQDFAASFEKTAVDTLVDKVLLAYQDFKPKTVVIAGGVAANQHLRDQLKQRLPVAINYAPMSLCTDNAAMVASAGYWYAKRKKPTDPYNLDVTPQLALSQ
jgi:N6-L-threonylcarbamoyladenine synthase